MKNRNTIIQTLLTVLIVSAIVGLVTSIMGKTSAILQAISIISLVTFLVSWLILEFGFRR